MASKPMFRGEDPWKADLLDIQPPDEAASSRIFY
jgi:hypothetical protein